MKRQFDYRKGTFDAELRLWRKCNASDSPCVNHVVKLIGINMETQEFFFPKYPAGSILSFLHKNNATTQQRMTLMHQIITRRKSSTRNRYYSL